jgi:hypothetical protein
MFEPLPEKPPHMASYWIMFIAGAGGFVGLYTGFKVFGEEGFQSNTVMFGSFAVGALAGLVAGWKLVIPSRPRSRE